MYRQIVAVGMALITCLWLSSCGLAERINLDSDLRDKVTSVSGDDGQHYIEYVSKRYHYDELKLFCVTEDEENSKNADVLLGWSGFRFGYINSYYSDVKEKPLFIYEARLEYVYLCDDYDYKSDIFVLEGTESKFVFSDALKDTDFAYDITKVYENQKDIVIYSDSYPRLQMHLMVFSSDGNWYVGGRINGAVFQISEEFVQILMQTN